MDRQTAIALWIAGAAITIVAALAGLVYRGLKADIERNAKNIHDLRAQMSPVTLWVEILKERTELVKLFTQMLDTFKEALRRRDE